MFKSTADTLTSKQLDFQNDHSQCLLVSVVMDVKHTSILQSAEHFVPLDLN